jgi:hypothetical protein
MQGRVAAKELRGTVLEVADFPRSIFSNQREDLHVNGAPHPFGTGIAVLGSARGRSTLRPA